MLKKITKQSVALDELTRKIINRVGNEKSLNFSASLRMIVREWDHLNRYRITEQGRQALEEREEQISNN